MKKYEIEDLLEMWKIFMGLCEDFPELYDLYVEKVEKDMEGYKLDYKLTEEDRKWAYENLLKSLQIKRRNNFLFIIECMV